MYHSAKREKPGNNFQRDLLEKSQKREELGTDLIEYIEYITDASGKREELGFNPIEYTRDGSNSISGASEKREELGTNVIEHIEYAREGPGSTFEASEKLELESGLYEHALASKRMV